MSSGNRSHASDSCTYGKPGHPLLGDTVYGSSKNPYHLQGQALHAMILGFIHPVTEEYMEFEAPIPEYFSKLLDKLRK